MIFFWRYSRQSSILRACWLLLAGYIACATAGPAAIPGETWKIRDDPQALGWSTERLTTVQQYTQTLGSAALFIVTEGEVVFSSGDPSIALPVHGVIDSIVSALIGVASSKGLIDINSTLADLAIDDYAVLTDQEKQATVVQLLQSRSGIYIPASSEAWGVWRPRIARDRDSPGSEWLYNVWGINAVATIFEKSADIGIFDAYKEWLAGPLGMQDFRVGDGTLIYGPTSLHPAYRFRASARDLARLGLLYLRQGRWGNDEIVPSDWIMNSTQVLSETSLQGTQGQYGAGWWIAAQGEHSADLGFTEGMYSASGAGGHRLVVIPQLDTVVVHLMSPGDPSTAVYIDSTFDRLLSLILDARLAHPDSSSPGALSYHNVSITAPSLANNLLSTPAVQPTTVYLPPNYDSQPDRQYPVVYLLPHFRETLFELLPDIEAEGKQWTIPAFSGVKLPTLLADLMSRKRIPDMIVVVPNSHDANYGSFYVNSPVGGNWETFIQQDLVNYVDKHYRTLANSASRGIAGHGMGGFGALRIAMKYPDTFSSVYALSPWGLAWEEEFSDENPIWLRAIQTTTRAQLDQAWRQGDVFLGLFTALGTAFSPNPNRAPLFVDWPFAVSGNKGEDNISVRAHSDNHLHDNPVERLANNLVANKDTRFKWQQSFPVNLIPGHRDNLAKLERVLLEYGTKDPLANVATGAQAFSRALAQNGIPHQLEIFKGRYNELMRERLSQGILPFFAETLQFQDH